MGDTGDVDTGQIEYDNQDNSMRFQTNAAETMRIDSSGNVNIGTTGASSGSHKLVVESASTTGTVNSHIALIGDSATIGQGPQILFSEAGDGEAYAGGTIGFTRTGSNSIGDLVFGTRGSSGDANTTTTERMRIDSSGHVVIQDDAVYTTNAPTHRGSLILAGASGSTSFGGIEFHTNAGGGAGYGTRITASDAEQSFLRRSNSASWTETMRLDTSGNLLVGKTSAGIDALGAIIKPSGDYYSTVASGTNTYHVYDTTNNVYTFYVGSNGGISNFSANNVNLSDEREKKNVEALPSQWDCLKHWDLKQFHYNADDDALPKKYGVIAQEIEPHCPEVIDVFKVDEDTERMGVKEQQMMWMAIKALQEAQTRIESLEARIAALES